MKIKKLQLLTLLISLLLFAACQEESHQPLVKGDGVPGKISNVKVENIPGGAKISYALPDDGDLLYVQAEFSSIDGEIRTAKSSLYKNFITVEGFPNTDEREIVLYSFNKGEVKSEPVLVKIQPLTPPILQAFNSLKVKEDFGGINLDIVNEFGKELVVNTLRKDELGNWIQIDRLYTQSKARNYSIRDMLAVEQEFAIYLVDSYRNISDTLFQTITPLYEELLDKKLWKRGSLLSDYYEAAYPKGTSVPREVEKLWDGLHGTYDYYFQHATAPPLPSWITIDLGKAMKLSRMKINQYEGSKEYMFALGNPREYEIWGSNVLEDDWEHWTKLLDCESIKPSGLPLGVRSNEDIEYATAGEDYTFPLETEPVRYIRFVLKKTWANTTALLLDEITLWGQDPNMNPM